MKIVIEHQRFKDEFNGGYFYAASTHIPIGNCMERIEAGGMGYRSYAEAKRALLDIVRELISDLGRPATEEIEV